VTDRSRVYLSLGSNVGRRLSNLRTAIRSLNDTRGIRVHEVSPVYESVAHTRHPSERMPPFLNAVVRVETDRPPAVLLDACMSIESAHGRLRTEGTWLPRTIDIDILVYADQVLDSQRLKVPHPRMAERRFVLLPFADLDPNAWVPEPFSTTVSTLLLNCPDRLRIDRRYPAHAVFSEEVVRHENG